VGLLFFTSSIYNRQSPLIYIYKYYTNACRRDYNTSSVLLPI